MRKSRLNKEDAVRDSVDSACKIGRNDTAETVLSTAYSDIRTYDLVRKAILSSTSITDTNYSVWIAFGLTESMRSL